MTENTIKSWQADGWLTMSDAEPGTTVPNDTERWIATPEPVEAER